MDSELRRLTLWLNFAGNIEHCVCDLAGIIWVLFMDYIILYPRMLLVDLYTGPVTMLFEVTIKENIDQYIAYDLCYCLLGWIMCENYSGVLISNSR